jgi:hypothetical protein
VADLGFHEIDTLSRTERRSRALGSEHPGEQPAFMLLTPSSTPETSDVKEVNGRTLRIGGGAWNISRERGVVRTSTRCSSLGVRSQKKSRHDALM